MFHSKVINVSPEAMTTGEVLPEPERERVLPSSILFYFLVMCGLRNNSIVTHIYK